MALSINLCDKLTVYDWQISVIYSFCCMSIFLSMLHLWLTSLNSIPVELLRWITGQWARSTLSKFEWAIIPKPVFSLKEIYIMVHILEIQGTWHLLSLMWFILYACPTYLIVQIILNLLDVSNGSIKPGTINSPFLTRGSNNEIYRCIKTLESK